MILLIIQWHKLVPESRPDHDNDDIIHVMSNREWTEEQKRKLVEIDRQERRRAKNFMKRGKTR